MMDWINVGRMNSFVFTISNGKRHVTGVRGPSNQEWEELKQTDAITYRGSEE